jgi:hypothetical protein
MNYTLAMLSVTNQMFDMARNNRTLGFNKVISDPEGKFYICDTGSEALPDPIAFGYVLRQIQRACGIETAGTARYSTGSNSDWIGNPPWHLVFGINLGNSSPGDIICPPGNSPVLPSDCPS